MFFGMSGVELFIILIFAFMIFGPDKLPALAKTAGKALAKFRSAQDEMNKVIKNEVFDPTAENPFKNPLDAADKAAKKAKEEKAKAEEKMESFAERKARYDRERAAKKAAEAQAAKPKVSAADLYGTNPTAKKKPAEEVAPKEEPAAKPALVTNDVVNAPIDASDEKGE